MVLGKLPAPGRPAYLDYSRQGPTALALSAGGVGWLVGHSSLIYHFSFPSPSVSLGDGPI